jgi:hypothetical protein
MTLEGIKTEVVSTDYVKAPHKFCLRTAGFLVNIHIEFSLLPKICHPHLLGQGRNKSENLKHTTISKKTVKDNYLPPCISAAPTILCGTE